MPKVLLVDDDEEMLRTVRDFLKLDSFNVDAAYNAEDAFALLAAASYDAIVLDWDLPDLPGIDILRRLRQRDIKTPVLMLTGKATIDDKTTGLDCGADDYLVKPFHLKELTARLRSLLRRSSAQVSNELKANCLVLNTASTRVTKQGEEIKLAPAELALLEFLMRHPNEVFGAEALISRVWPTDQAVSSESVRTCVKRLRQKIGDLNGEPIIQTVHSMGYKLHAPEKL